MTKCDFCTKSDQKGKCFYGTSLAREKDCNNAIERMIRAFQNMNSDKKRK